MRIVYIADDGTQFDDEFECNAYEWKLNHSHLKDIGFFDEDGNIVSGSPFDDAHYNKVETIVIPNEKALRDLQALAEYTGFCDYDNINAIGTWKHYNDNWDSGFAIV